MTIATLGRCTALAAMLGAAAAAAGPVDLRYSIDPASPAIDGNITPDDVLLPGPAVSIQGRTLGLQDRFAAGSFDNLADFSFGKDPIRNPLYFSVDRVAVGLPGSAVFGEALPGIASAAGDVFLALPPSGSNVLVVTGASLGLTPGFFGDDVDGLNIGSRPTPNTYFAIDRQSATNAFGSGTLASDLLVSAGNGRFSVYATNAMMGLNPRDAIDGLVLKDRQLDEVANPHIDRALFSLDPISPDTFTATHLPYIPCVPGHMSPGDVCSTDFDGHFSLWASAADIGLAPGDNVDALATVSEPDGLLLAGSALLLLWLMHASTSSAAGARSRGTPPRSARQAGLRLMLAGLVAAVPAGARAAAAADELIGPSFYGLSPPVAASHAALLLREDVAHQPVFLWHSADTTLRTVDTQAFVTASSWNYFPGSPARLLFQGSAGGATFYGDVLFAPYNRAVVDVVKDGARVRYLLVAGCQALAIVPPPPKTVAAQTWTLSRAVSARDGLVVSQAMLGTRLMARQMSLPYLLLRTTAFSGRVELTPNGTAITGRSRLVDFWESVDADWLVLEATYVIDHISSANSKSCVLVTQHDEFGRLQNRFSFMPDPACEPSEQSLPATPRSLQCARFKSTVKYAFIGDRGESLVSIQAPQRLHFQPDNRLSSTINFIRDHDSFDMATFAAQLALYVSNPLLQPQPMFPFDVLPGPASLSLLPFGTSGPPLPTETVVSGLRRGNAGDWDNYHHTWEPTLGLPLPPPGCAECVHLHWRWAAFLAFPPGTTPGRPVIPAGSDQDLQLGVVRFKAGETHPANWRTLLNGEALTGGPSDLAVLWYESTGYRRRDAFFVHDGFFGSPVRVLLNTVTAVAGSGGFNYQFVVTNTSEDPIAGPVYLVLDGLTNPTGTIPLGVTKNIAPLGSPYFPVNIGGNVFEPGQAVTITIFIPNLGSDPAVLGYNARVLTGDITP